MKSLFDGIRTAATISECGTYRYDLHRWWDESLRACVFVMLNPSTADATLDDPTIRRCIGFAKGWGFGGLVVVNLFALRATDPKVMKRHPSPVGPENDRHIRHWLEQGGRLIAAWGTHGTHRGRDREVVEIMRKVGVRVHHLGTSKGGQPKHPLYIPANVKPAMFLEPDGPDDDDPDCMCGDSECPQCNSDCHYCGGEGWGLRGHDWPNDDPINDPDGEVEKCPCCHGSGEARDCTFW